MLKLPYTSLGRKVSSMYCKRSCPFFIYRYEENKSTELVTYKSFSYLKHPSHSPFCILNSAYLDWKVCNSKHIPAAIC